MEGLSKEGIDYRGFLFIGLMNVGGDPFVIEYNVRMGDPETQPIMARLRSDLVEVGEATLDGRLADVEAKWDPRAALGVVMAAGGYPESYGKGMPISGLEQLTPGSKVFHAGTDTSDGNVVTSGGRVLCVVGLGDSVSDARDIAYGRVDGIDWDGAYYRRDIGHRAIAVGRI